MKKIILAALVASVSAGAALANTGTVTPSPDWDQRKAGESLDVNKK
jgi:hypothetical protein